MSTQQSCAHMADDIATRIVGMANVPDKIWWIQLIPYHSKCVHVPPTQPATALRIAKVGNTFRVHHTLMFEETDYMWTLLSDIAQEFKVVGDLALHQHVLDTAELLGQSSKCEDDDCKRCQGPRRKEPSEIHVFGYAGDPKKANVHWEKGDQLAFDETIVMLTQENEYFVMPVAKVYQLMPRLLRQVMWTEGPARFHINPIKDSTQAA